MKEHPILFSAPMVRALLDGSKTQTRRVMKTQLVYGDVCGLFPSWYLPNRARTGGTLYPNAKDAILATCPYGQPGDRLYVRETFGYNPDHPGILAHCCYRADPGHEYDGITWKPSIHMPRRASRILLEIVSVRVERLNDISEADARAEGLHRYAHVWRDCEYPLPDVAYEPSKGSSKRFSCPVQAYQALWESINGPGSWSANPWVWCVEFKRVTP